MSHLIGPIPSEDNPKLIAWDEEDSNDYVIVVEFNVTKDQQDVYVLDDS